VYSAQGAQFNEVRLLGDHKAVTADLKRIDKSVTEEETIISLDGFTGRWDDKYPQISKSWRTHWDNLNTLFNDPEDIRRAIDTTHAI
jgi:transposase-like protein